MAVVATCKAAICTKSAFFISTGPNKVYRANFQDSAEPPIFACDRLNDMVTRDRKDYSGIGFQNEFAVFRGTFSKIEVPSWLNAYCTSSSENMQQTSKITVNNNKAGFRMMSQSIVTLSGKIT